MDDKEIKHEIYNNEDFIKSKRFKNSLVNFMERYPDGGPAYLIAQCLMMTESEVEDRYSGIVKNLQKSVL